MVRSFVMSYILLMKTTQLIFEHSSEIQYGKITNYYCRFMVTISHF